jgi:hypothetical protein
VQFDALWSSTSMSSSNNEASTSQVSVETCDEAIAQENDHLKLEVKRLGQMVSELVLKCDHLKITLQIGCISLRRVQPSLSKFSNNQARLNLSRSNKRPLKRKILSMQEVHT